MSRRVTFHLSVSVVTVVAAFILNWLLLGETSPASHYFLWHVGLPNAWRIMNIVPAIIAAIAGGNPHSGNEFVFYVVFAIQWLLVGLLFSLVLLLFRMKREKATTILGKRQP